MARPWAHAFVPRGAGMRSIIAVVWGSGRGVSVVRSPTSEVRSPRSEVLGPEIRAVIFFEHGMVIIL